MNPYLPHEHCIVIVTDPPRGLCAAHGPLKANGDIGRRRGAAGLSRDMTIE